MAGKLPTLPTLLLAAAALLAARADAACDRSAAELRAERLSAARQWRLSCVHLNVATLEEFYDSLAEVAHPNISEDVFQTGVWAPLDSVQEYNLLSNPKYNGGLIEWTSMEMVNLRWNDSAHQLYWELNEVFRFPNEHGERDFVDTSGTELITFEECGARIVYSQLRLPDEISKFSLAHPTEPRDLCDIAALVCPDDFFPYPTVADCVAFMEQLPAFCDGFTLMGNTSQCRNLHAVNALLNPVVHCPHLAPDSPVCVQMDCPDAQQLHREWPDPLRPRAPAAETVTAVSFAALVVGSLALGYLALRLRVWLLERRLAAERRRRVADAGRERSVFRPWGMPMYRFVFAFVDYASEADATQKLQSIARPKGRRGRSREPGNVSRSGSSPSLSPSRTGTTPSRTPSQSRLSSRSNSARRGGTASERRRERQRRRDEQLETEMAEVAAARTPAEQAELDEAAWEATRRRPLILRDVCGMFNPGELVAIMGPSGCGKTTLLKLLARRRKFGTLKGINLMVDASQLAASTYDPGRLVFPTDRWFRKHVAFVPQEDFLRPGLTVRQTLEYYSLLKLPPTMTLAEKMDRVEEIIEEMGLAGCADRLVGVERGISGGQRRRLTTAVQLLTHPSAVFLDEPTSGLDATSALDLVRTLSRLASRGRTIVLSIHQPREDIFKLFDTVLLLSSEGSTAYAGPPHKVVQHLQAIVGRHKRLVHQLKASNPADFIMDVLSRRELQADVARSYRRSHTRRQIEKEAAELYELQRQERRRRLRHEKGDNMYRQLFSKKQPQLESSHDLHKMSRSGREVVEVRVPIEMSRPQANAGGSGSESRGRSRGRGRRGRGTGRAGAGAGAGAESPRSDEGVAAVDSGPEFDEGYEGVHSEPGSPLRSPRVPNVSRSALSAAAGDTLSPMQTPRGKRSGAEGRAERAARRRRNRLFPVPFTDVLTVQMARFLRRTPTAVLYSLPLGAAVMSAVLISIYWDLGKSNLQDMLYRVFVLFAGLLTLFYTSMFQLTALFVPFEKVAFRHDWESGVAGFYHFHAHQLLRDSHVVLVAVVVFYLPLYYGVGLRSEPERVATSVLLVSLIALLIQSFVSLFFVLMRAVSATLVSGVYIGVQVLFAGVLRKIDDMPPYWAWAPVVTPLYYALGSLLQVEMRGLDMDCDALDLSPQCSTGDEMLKALGYDEVDVATSLWVLSLSLVGLRALAIGVAWVQNRRLVLLRLKPDHARVARARNSHESLRRPRRSLVAHVLEATAFTRSDPRQQAMQFLSHQREKDESWEETVRKMAMLRWKLIRENLSSLRISLSRVGTPTSPISPLDPASPMTSGDLSASSRSSAPYTHRGAGFLDTSRLHGDRSGDGPAGPLSDSDDGDETDDQRRPGDDPRAGLGPGSLSRDSSGFGLHNITRHAAPPEMDTDDVMSEPRQGLHPRARWPRHQSIGSLHSGVGDHVSVLTDSEEDADEDADTTDDEAAADGADGAGAATAARKRKVKSKAGKARKTKARRKGDGKKPRGLTKKRRLKSSKATSVARPVARRPPSAAGNPPPAPPPPPGAAAAAAAPKKKKAGKAKAKGGGGKAKSKKEPTKRSRSQPPENRRRAAAGGSGNTSGSEAEDQLVAAAARRRLRYGVAAVDTSGAGLPPRERAHSLSDGHTPLSGNSNASGAGGPSSRARLSFSSKSRSANTLAAQRREKGL